MRNIRLFLMLILVSAVAFTGCQQAAETPAPTATEAAPVPEETQEPQAPPVRQPRNEESDTGDLGLPAAPILQPDATASPTPTEEPEPTATLPTPTETAEPSEDTALEEPASAAEPASPEASDDDAESQEAASAPAVNVVPAPPTTESVVSTSALVIRDDETPAPPLIVTVSSNREFPGYNFLITGLVRNGGSENYAGLDIIGTFFRADGSRHGPIQVNLQCPVLAPGEACPFRIDANAKGLTEVMLHPEGYPTTRATADVTISNVRTSLDGIGYVHITGSVTNPNPVPVWDVTLNGVLIDATGAILSLGTDVLVGALDAGATADFDVPVRYQPYAQYQLFVYAEPR